MNIFSVILYQPLFNALILLYDYLPGHSFGAAIIALTIVIRFILYPLMASSIKSQKTLNELQPKLQEIQKKYKDDKEKQALETMELYKKEKFNPFGGCLPLLVQLPILWTLYQVFSRGLNAEEAVYLYKFVPNPGQINSVFLRILDLSKAALHTVDGKTQILLPNMILLVLVGIAQFIQTKMSSAKTKISQGGQAAQFSEMMQKQMLYFFPVLTTIILLKLPSAIALYWLVTTLFSIVQQYLIYKKQNHDRPR
ncbi:MAG: YidC/Oxa1 family membrane protein insertase [Candidatus Pacebacteria bacterium]|nr:YidC/Oxa1 family membrane protein insertase [Candidatus Paceibacterota bacterium]